MAAAGATTDVDGIHQTAGALEVHDPEDGIVEASEALTARLSSVLWHRALCHALGSKLRPGLANRSATYTETPAQAK